MSLGFAQIYIKVILRYRNAKLFLVGNPPLVSLLPLVCRNRYYQLFFDLDLVRLLDKKAIKKFKMFRKLLENLLRNVLKNADGIFTISKGMAEILNKFSNGKHVHIMSLWSDNQYFKPIEKRNNPFIHKHNLQDKFIVMYSGNLGAYSGVEVLIELARAINNKDILFIIIGEGILKKSLIKKRNEFRLENCIFLPWQHPDILPFSLAAADLAVVSLAESEGKHSMPSKLYNNLSVGVPILCISSANSDLFLTVNELNVGRSFETRDIVGMVNFINELYANKDLHEKYCQNSLLASRKFTASNIEIILNNL